jgi:hypothetical protein
MPYQEILDSDEDADDGVSPAKLDTAQGTAELSGTLIKTPTVQTSSTGADTGLLLT